MAKKSNTYETATGRVITLRPISPFEIDEVRRTVEVPKAPVRKIQTALPGYEEEEPLSLDLPDLTDEERASLRRHERELAAANTEINQRVTDFLLVEGIEFDLEGLEEWKARRIRWKMPIPDDDQELRIAYVRTAIIGSLGDIEEIMARLTVGHDLDEREMASVRDTFRRRLRRDALVQTPDAEREVDIQQPPDRDAGGESVASDA